MPPTEAAKLGIARLLVSVERKKPLGLLLPLVVLMDFAKPSEEMPDADMDVPTPDHHVGRPASDALGRLKVNVARHHDLQGVLHSNRKTDLWLPQYHLVPGGRNTE